MTQAIDKQVEEEFDVRHDLYVTLMEALILEKEKLLAEKNASIEAMEKKFTDWKEYQDHTGSIAKYKREIEEAIVEGEFLNIKVENMKSTVLSLQAKKDQLAEEKQIAFQKYEETKTSYQAQEDLKEKKLINKLNRDKSQTIKDLIANLELIEENNKEVSQKL